MTDRIPPLAALRAFAAVARHGSFARAALALHFAFYNFCRVHGTVKMTPAMAAGLTQRRWALEDLLA